MVVIFFISGLLLFAAFQYISWRRNPKKSRPENLLSAPQPPHAWPILGHLHLLGGDDHTCFTFSKLADKYGPVFSLRLGLQHAVVISSRGAVMEAFTIRDKSFSNRPRNSPGEHLVYEYSAFGFANGLFWRDMRKLVSSEVLSTRSIEKMKNLRVSEIDLSIKELYFQAVKNQNPEPKTVNLSQWTEQMTLNIIVKTLAGKRYGTDPDGSVPEEVRIFRRLISDITNLTGQFVLSDVIRFPFLKWVDPKGYIKSMKRVSEELDGILESWIDEHLRRRSSGEVKDEPDFIDVMLSNIDDRLEKIHGKTKMTVIKATIVNVILGGFDTTSVFLTWALSLLVQHKEAMHLAQKEIDSKIGKQRWVQESDLKNLVYLQAVVKESLRLYPPLPLSVPHEAVEDSELCGYFVPKGALLFVNLWKLHRDPQFWPEPEEFQPERFLSGQAQMDVLGQHFEYTPFGSGRRICPGITFVAHVGNLTLARLLQGFDFVTPGDQKVDMSVGFGVTIPRANPLQVLITPRLHTQLYEG
ncbi:nicotine N-demethylase CYP82E3-like [Primulina huaijiensis]|uniref:nicotine N-demethylase CYP82E3-like n=1 Tax=Primulina huaijiensis TaxID=1492673 RepID=UPI003CC7770B